MWWVYCINPRDNHSKISQFSVQIFRHLQVHGATKGFACSNCPKIFKQFSQLRVHGITHHQIDSSQMRWYSQKKCEICHNMFANSKVLSKHIKTVHNQIKPFICNVCGHKSARKVTHLIHLRQHTGEKPISCQYCQFKAADPSVIKKHELRHQAVREHWKVLSFVELTIICGLISERTMEIQVQWLRIHVDTIVHSEITSEKVSSQ